MAAARDQAARIVRETANDEVGPEAGAQLADQSRNQITDETRRGPADAPSGPGIRRCGETRQAQNRHDRRARTARAGCDRLRRLLLPGRALLCLDGRCLRSRQQHHARCPRRRPCRGNSSARQFDRSRRRRDFQNRRRRLSHREGCRAQQDRDPGGDHRPYGCAPTTAAGTPSTVSAVRSRRSKAPSSRPRRNSLPRRRR